MNNEIDKELRDWLGFATQPAEPKTTFVCGRCRREFRSTMGDGHWNYCPHCGNIHSAAYLLVDKPELRAEYLRQKANRRTSK